MKGCRWSFNVLIGRGRPRFDKFFCVRALDAPKSGVIQTRNHNFLWLYAMRCPKCGCQEDKVIDSRASREGATIRRRRECLNCRHRFTTYEEIEHEGLLVLKGDGRREEFSREKLVSGIKKACQKRPVSQKAIEDLVEDIKDRSVAKFDREIPAEVIGKMVMDGLRELDGVAYVRFASVYRRFQEANDFVSEVKKLEKAP